MADRSFDGPWGRATREVVHEIATHASYASDHMQGMAAVTTAPRVVFSLSTLSRTVMESLARACWIYEPGIDTRERVRRVYNVRLESLREELNMLSGLRADGPRWPDPERESSSSTRAKILKIKMGAQRAGFTYTTRKPNRRVTKKPNRRVPALAPARYLDKPVPSAQRLLTQMFEPLTSPDTNGRPDLGPIIHRLTSATAHGQSHGMQFFVMGQSESIRGVEGLADIQLGLSLSHFSNIVGSVVLAVQATVARLCAYYGWPLDPWVQVLQPAADSMSRWLELERRAEDPV